MLKIIVVLIPLLLTVLCNHENKDFPYVSKKLLETRSKMLWSDIKHKAKNPEEDLLVISQHDSNQRNDSMFFVREQFVISTKGVGDTLLFVNEKSINTEYLFDSKKKTPLAICIYYADLYSHKEIVIDENVLLRKRLYPETQLLDYSSKYYYVGENEYQQIALGKKQPLFIEKEFLSKYLSLQKKGMLNTFLLINDFSYDEKLRPYNVQVVFTKKK